MLLHNKGEEGRIWEDVKWSELSIIGRMELTGWACVGDSHGMSKGFHLLLGFRLRTAQGSCGSVSLTDLSHVADCRAISKDTWMQLLDFIKVNFCLPLLQCQSPPSACTELRCLCPQPLSLTPQSS